MSEAAPAFVTIVMIPFTFDVGTGVIAGLAASLVCNASSRLRPMLHRRRWLGCCLDKEDGNVDVLEAAASDIVTNSVAMEAPHEPATNGSHDHIKVHRPHQHPHHHSPLMHAMLVSETDV